MATSLVDQLPWVLLLTAGVALALAPFAPEPHLVEKLRMLRQGTLRRPIDVFDLAMHAAPLVLIAIKVRRSPRPTSGRPANADKKATRHFKRRRERELADTHSAGIQAQVRKQNDAQLKKARLNVDPETTARRVHVPRILLAAGVPLKKLEMCDM